MSSLDAVFAHIEAEKERSIARLIDYARQPSISASGEGMDDAAQLLVAHLTSLNFATELVPFKGYPFVLARYVVDPDKPTVLLYGHYDVQPARMEDGWSSAPFEPVVHDGRIWGRGVGDNKGQHFAQLLAIEAHLAVHGTLPCNVIFCLEGEEEVGSPHIADFVAAHGDRLQADLVITADGPLHASGAPAVLFGVRGIVSFDLLLEHERSDLHSGNFGGVVPNPLWDMVHLLASMKDSDGTITIDGIEGRAAPPTPLERRAMADLPMDLSALKSELGLSELDAPHDRPYWERLMFHPTLTINGISGGYDGPGSKTVLPRAVRAKCDMRLVEPLTPEYALERVRAHVARRAPQIQVIDQGSMLPSKTPMDSPFAEVLIEAITRARGQKPLLYPSMGGSLPEYVWTKILKKPSFVVPYANADQRNHGPDENLEVVRFIDGIRCGAAMLEALGTARL